MARPRGAARTSPYSTSARLLHVDRHPDRRRGRAGLQRYGANPGLDAVPLMAEGRHLDRRDEAFWACGGDHPGVIQFPQRVKDYKAALDANNVDFLNILDYGNPLYYPDEAPSTDEQRAAFTRYAVAAVDEFGTAHTTYELWNEWNWRDLDGPAGGTAGELRRTAQDGEPGGPGEAPGREAHRSVARGHLRLAGLVHQVRGPRRSGLRGRGDHPPVRAAELDPEASVAYVNTIRSIMAAHGSTKPIYITEQGWATGTNPSAVSPSRRRPATWSAANCWPSATVWPGTAPTTSWTRALTRQRRAPVRPGPQPAGLAWCVGTEAVVRRDRRTGAADRRAAADRPDPVRHQRVRRRLQRRWWTERARGLVDHTRAWWLPPRPRARPSR